MDQIDAFTEVCQDGKEIGPGMSFQTWSTSTKSYDQSNGNLTSNWGQEELAGQKFEVEFVEI